MKRLIPLLLLFCFVTLSCSNEPECTSVWQKIEDNYKEAAFKCNGFANSYPSLSLISEERLPFDCELMKPSVEVKNSVNSCGLATKQVVTIYIK